LLLIFIGNGEQVCVVSAAPATAPLVAHSTTHNSHYHYITIPGGSVLARPSD
jgi:hypothetical protein